MTNKFGPELEAVVLFQISSGDNHNHTKKSFMVIHGIEQWHISYMCKVAKLYRDKTLKKLALSETHRQMKSQDVSNMLAQTKRIAITSEFAQTELDDGGNLYQEITLAIFSAASG